LRHFIVCFYMRHNPSFLSRDRIDLAIKQFGHRQMELCEVLRNRYQLQAVVLGGIEMNSEDDIVRYWEGHRAAAHQRITIMRQLEYVSDCAVVIQALWRRARARELVGKLKMMKRLTQERDMLQQTVLRQQQTDIDIMQAEPNSNFRPPDSNFIPPDSNFSQPDSNFSESKSPALPIRRQQKRGYLEQSTVDIKNEQHQQKRGYLEQGAVNFKDKEHHEKRRYLEQSAGDIKDEQAEIIANAKAEHEILKAERKLYLQDELRARLMRAVDGQELEEQAGEQEDERDENMTAALHIQESQQQQVQQQQQQQQHDQHDQQMQQDMIDADLENRLRLEDRAQERASQIERFEHKELHATVIASAWRTKVAVDERKEREMQRMEECGTVSCVGSPFRFKSCSVTRPAEDRRLQKEALARQTRLRQREKERNKVPSSMTSGPRKPGGVRASLLEMGLAPPSPPGSPPGSPPRNVHLATQHQGQDQGQHQGQHQMQHQGRHQIQHQGRHQIQQQGRQPVQQQGRRGSLARNATLPSQRNTPTPSAVWGGSTSSHPHSQRSGISPPSSAWGNRHISSQSKLRLRGNSRAHAGGELSTALSPRAQKLIHDQTSAPRTSHHIAGIMRDEGGSGSSSSRATQRSLRQDRQRELVESSNDERLPSRAGNSVRWQDQHNTSSQRPAAESLDVSV
jgi:hypothetical protein